jgi:hypothetical protein
MRAHTSTRPMTVVGLAFAGALAGHALTYAWLIRGPAERASVLHATGHGYLANADGFGMVAALVSLAVLFLSRLTDPAGHGLPFRTLVVGVAGFQVFTFAALEITERLHVGASLGDLPRVLSAGTLVEVAVAIAVAAVLRAVLRAAEVVADAISRAAPASPRPSVARRRPPLPAVPNTAARGTAGIRAPPLATGP